MIRRPMKDAPRDGTRILLEYYDSWQGVRYAETCIKEVYWRSKDLGGSEAGWRAWCGDRRVQSTARYYDPIGWYPNPRTPLK